MLTSDDRGYLIIPYPASSGSAAGRDIYRGTGATQAAKPAQAGSAHSAAG